MANDFKSLEKAYVKLKSDCAALHAKMGDAIKTISKTNATLKKTMESLRERIQELKNEGSIGTKIRDFVADKDVRMLYAIVQGYSQSAEKNRDQAEGKVKVKVILIEFKKLKDAVVFEANEAKDKGQADDGKKYDDLLKKVSALETDKLGIKRLVSYDPEDIGSAADLDNRLKKMIAEIKPDKSKAKAPAAPKGYDAKSLKNQLVDFKHAWSQGKVQYAEAVKAEKARDGERLTAIQAKLKTILAEMDDLADHFEKAVKDKKTLESIVAAADGARFAKELPAAVAAAKKAKTAIEKALKLEVK